jgi:choline dehydrogenase
MPNLVAPDLELQFAPVVFYEYGLAPITEHGMTIGPTLISPRSLGTMCLRSPDPFDHPLIDPQYLSDSEGHDIQVLIAGVRKAQAIFAAEPMKAYLGASIMPERVLKSDREIAIPQGQTTFTHSPRLIRAATSHNGAGASSTYKFESSFATHS